MDATTPAKTVKALRTYAGLAVRLRLADGTEHVGMLRTELLTERSISVFLSRGNGEGETIYIDQIGEISPQS